MVKDGVDKERVVRKFTSGVVTVGSLASGVGYLGTCSHCHQRNESAYQYRETRSVTNHADVTISVCFYYCTGWEILERLAREAYNRADGTEGSARNQYWVSLSTWSLYILCSSAQENKRAMVGPLVMKTREEA